MCKTLSRKKCRTLPAYWNINYLFEDRIKIIKEHIYTRFPFSYIPNAATAVTAMAVLPPFKTKYID